MQCYTPFHLSALQSKFLSPQYTHPATGVQRSEEQEVPLVLQEELWEVKGLHAKEHKPEKEGKGIMFLPS